MLNGFNNRVIKNLFMERKKSVESVIWGFVIGDCLGVPYEFKSKGSFKYEAMKGYGTHGQEAMTWSDDTSMMLALIDSYEEDRFNLQGHKDNLKKMLRGYYSVNNDMFDVGLGTRMAIMNDFQTDVSNSLGNGGLLRCWLVGILNNEQLPKFISLTHSSADLYMNCCNLYISLLSNVLEYGDEGKTKWQNECKDTFKEVINSNERLRKSEGCIVETIDIVISSYLYGKTIKKVVELGGDTDSNAALFCALKGAENDESILKYKKYVRDYDRIESFIGKL